MAYRVKLFSASRLQIYKREPLSLKNDAMSLIRTQGIEVHLDYLNHTNYIKLMRSVLHLFIVTSLVTNNNVQISPEYRNKYIFYKYG